MDYLKVVEITPTLSAAEM